MKRVVFVTVLIFLILFNFQCKTNDETNLIEIQQAEEAAGQAARLVTNIISSIYIASINLTNYVGERMVRFDNTTELNGSYNNNTGWWTVSVNFTGYQATLEIQLQDESGNFHENFNANTNKILVKSSGSGPDMTFTIDWAITDIADSSGSYMINGSGTMEYKGKSVSLTLLEIEIKKDDATNPSSGSLTIEAGGIVFVLNYDGNSIITVNYSYNGEDHKIVINIHTGAVIRLS